MGGKNSGVEVSKTCFSLLWWRWGWAPGAIKYRSLELSLKTSDLSDLLAASPKCYLLVSYMRFNAYEYNLFSERYCNFWHVPQVTAIICLVNFVFSWWLLEIVDVFFSTMYIVVYLVEMLFSATHKKLRTSRSSLSAGFYQWVPLGEVVISR